MPELPRPARPDRPSSPSRPARPPVAADPAEPDDIELEPPLWEQWKRTGVDPSRALVNERPDLPQGDRLQKVLAHLGYGSRRTCEELISAGRVTVNGEVADLGRRIDLDTDQVTVDGVAVSVRPGLVYYLLNKPAGVVTTAADPQGRRTVVDLVPDQPRVYPVGRLDYDTEGLLLLTNDGELTHRLTHPSFGVEKEYLAHVTGTPTPATLRTLRQGVELDDGMTAPAKVSMAQPGVVRLVIHEGRNRQVRRMCEAVGHPVVRLVRVRIGPLADRRLKPGAWRELTSAEVRALQAAASGVETEGPPPDRRPDRRSPRRPDR